MFLAKPVTYAYNRKANNEAKGKKKGKPTGPCSLPLFLSMKIATGLQLEVVELLRNHELSDRARGPGATRSG